MDYFIAKKKILKDDPEFTKRQLFSLPNTIPPLETYPKNGSMPSAAL